TSTVSYTDSAKPKVSKPGPRFAEDPGTVTVTLRPTFSSIAMSVKLVPFEADHTVDCLNNRLSLQQFNGAGKIRFQRRVGDNDQTCIIIALFLSDCTQGDSLLREQASQFSQNAHAIFHIH